MRPYATSEAAGRGTWLRALVLLLAVFALALPASAAPPGAHPASQEAADCAGHGGPSSDPRHADLCCAFHCAPAVPLVAPAMQAPLLARLRFARATDEALHEVGRRVPVPPPRRV